MYGLAMESSKRVVNNLLITRKSYSPNHGRAWNPGDGSKLVGGTHLWWTGHNFPCLPIPLFKQGRTAVRAYGPGIGFSECRHPDQSETSWQGWTGDDTPFRAVPVF